MTMKRIGALSALLLTFAVLAGACSSDSKSSADGDKTAFCKTNTEINDSAKNVTSADEFLTVIKAQQGKLDAFLKNAPKEIKSDAQTLVDAAKKAISSGDPTPFQTDTKIQAAGEKVDSFCGSSSSSSS
jgi:DNA repair exonuclease SbcCD ATPase subunit